MGGRGQVAENRKSPEGNQKGSSLQGAKKSYARSVRLNKKLMPSLEETLIKRVRKGTEKARKTADMTESST